MKVATFTVRIDASFVQNNEVSSQVIREALTRSALTPFLTNNVSVTFEGIEDDAESPEQQENT